MSDGINRIKGHNEIAASITTNDATDAAQAPLASPAFTGTPTAPTAAPATNTTQIATTAFVLANSSPSGANVTLSNLGTTAINASLIPDTADAYNLGGPVKDFNNLFVNNLFVDGARSVNVAGRTLTDHNGNSMFVWAAPRPSLASNRLTDAADPVDPQDVATKNYVDNRVLSFTSSATVGGAASEAVTLTGILATDTILSVSQSVAGAAVLPLLGFNTLANNSLTLVYSADPGSGAIVVVSVKR